MRGIATGRKKVETMSMRVAVILALLATAIVPATPLVAQERVLTIFGDDKCPTDTICVVAPESERYRIPKPFRERLRSPDSQSWAVRSQATISEGKSGVGSCSSTGAGGWTGCWAAYMQSSRAGGSLNPYRDKRASSR
jgi:hypothetical protein